jgi:hypothetical protein
MCEWKLKDQALPSKDISEASPFHWRKSLGAKSAVGESSSSPYLKDAGL